MPVNKNDHHAQLFATPPFRTKSVTRFGVSVENVVATIDTPTNHHGAERPDYNDQDSGDIEQRRWVSALQDVSADDPAEGERQSDDGCEVH